MTTRETEPRELGLSLAELIEYLDAQPDKNRVLPLGFANPQSYRGYYEDLMFEPRSHVTIGEMLDAARSALGATYHGWKGGEYTMSGYTRCWLAWRGYSDGEVIGRILLGLMLRTADQRDRISQLEQLATDMLSRYTKTDDGHRARVGQVQIAKWRQILAGEQ